MFLTTRPYCLTQLKNSVYGQLLIRPNAWVPLILSFFFFFKVLFGFGAYKIVLCARCGGGTLKNEGGKNVYSRYPGNIQVHYPVDTAILAVVCVWVHTHTYIDYLKSVCVCVYTHTYISFIYSINIY